MGRPVPLWVLLLFILLFGVSTILFGWAVKSALSGNENRGAFGRTVVWIATIPTTTYNAILEFFDYVSGDFEDGQISVQREESADYTGFQPIPAVPSIEIPGLLMRANPSRISNGWRVLAGAFQVNGRVENAALLISPDLKVVKIWKLDEIPVNDLEPRPKHRKFVHGVEILQAGSLIFTFDGSISLQRIDSCGERKWAAGGKYHHAVTLDDTGETVWTLGGGDSIVQVAVEDGAVLRSFSKDDIVAKNPTIDVLDIRRLHPNDVAVNSRNTVGKWLKDPNHFNDVDPLPTNIADRFEGFSAGDLLLSDRSLNLVLVLDPDTLEVKWWRIGASQRQHDPEWLANGEIMILNNRMSRDYSEIFSIDPVTFKKTVMFDGRENDFYTRIRGKNQFLEDGTIVVTSPQQGRAFEVDRDGNVVFEIVNLKPESDTTNYVVSELRWLPRDYFDMETWQCPLKY